MITDARTRLALISATLLFCVAVAFSQTESATVSGRVTDTSGSVVPGTEVQLQSTERGTSQQAVSNQAGIYSFPIVQPGQYHMTLRKPGFRQIEFVGLVVNVQDHLEKNFQLQVGSVSESVTVTGGAPLVDTEDASVSTVVDRNFAENLPMNGRSFQSLVQLTPGVVLTPSNAEDNGQFSVDGQRASSNYWMVDGVGANIGIGVHLGLAGNGLAGAIGSYSVVGGTNSLVSVDALQEFRIQTSTYAPEFGRTPGAQISIVTRSGTNGFHGTAFDYFRNDILDANNWFADSLGLRKPRERQNDFGSTFAGPILKDRTFFFFSYEGLRLRLPETTLTTVPDLSARQNAIPAMQPFLNAFPMPNGTDDVTTGTAQFNASYSVPASLNAYSIRIDHNLNHKLTLFGRYNYSPSEMVQRGGSGIGSGTSGSVSLNVLQRIRITTQTATVGSTWLIAPIASNDLRFNYSRTNAASNYSMDGLGGAVPLQALPFPSPFSIENSQFVFNFFTLQGGEYIVGKDQHNLQRQINLVDSLAIQKQSHSLKFGVDFRRLSPLYAPFAYQQEVFFADVPSSEQGNPIFGSVGSGHGAPVLLHNLGFYAQDTWRITPRFAVTYGLRWDVDFAPTSVPPFNAVAGFNLSDLSQLTLLPAGTAPYKTKYGNVAPRVGAAYQLRQSQNWQMALRGGFGVFYDLASSEAGNSMFVLAYPLGSSAVIFGGTFPYSSAMIEPPPINVSSLSSPFSELFAFDPNLTPPHALEWNVAVEQGLGNQQTISASYIGSAGRRLLQSAVFLSTPNPNFSSAHLVTNTGMSDYNALQVLFQRRLHHGLQGLASYTWSHSIDTGSAGSSLIASNLQVPLGIAGSNRGPSDFDIRNALSAGITYEFPTPKNSAFADAILRGWSVANFVIARSAPPVDITDATFFEFNGGLFADTRPDIVPEQSFYLHGSQYPGQKAVNPAAFTNPPADPTTGNPLRQGTTPRNLLRGFGAAQWDFGVHREFHIREQLKLQFRAEIFNALNHPNFGPPDNQFGTSGFGLSNQTLGQSLSGLGGAGGGAFSPLYQIGGPRSMQFALRLIF